VSEADREPVLDSCSFEGSVYERPFLITIPGIATIVAPPTYLPFSFAELQ
jgi:hypothetical protein